MVLATIKKICCSPDMKNCEVYNTTNFTSNEPALHIILQKIYNIYIFYVQKF